MPLLDVVLQIIVFFMILVHFGSRIEGETRAVRLPKAPAALPGEDLPADRLAVAIDSGGRLLAEGEILEGTAAEAFWIEQAKARRAGLETLGDAAGELPTLVIVRADREADYGAVRRTLLAAQARGFARFSLVVLKEKSS